MKNVELPITEELETNSLAQLWRRYGFPGTAPGIGTVAAERLYETCQQYVSVMRARGKTVAGSLENNDSENVHSSENKDTYAIKRGPEL